MIPEITVENGQITIIGRPEDVAEEVEERCKAGWKILPGSGKVTGSNQQKRREVTLYLPPDYLDRIAERKIWETEEKARVSAEKKTARK